MEITTVHYNKSSHGLTTKWNGDFEIRDMGVILVFSPGSQMFIPWHRVDRIEQAIVGSDGGVSLTHRTRNWR